MYRLLYRCSDANSFHKFRTVESIGLHLLQTVDVFQEIEFYMKIHSIKLYCLCCVDMILEALLLRCLDHSHTILCVVEAWEVEKTGEEGGEAEETVAE